MAVSQLLILEHQLHAARQGPEEGNLALHVLRVAGGNKRFPRSKVGIQARNLEAQQRHRGTATKGPHTDLRLHQTVQRALQPKRKVGDLRIAQAIRNPQLKGLEARFAAHNGGTRALRDQAA